MSADSLPSADFSIADLDSEEEQDEVRGKGKRLVLETSALQNVLQHLTTSHLVIYYNIYIL